MKSLRSAVAAEQQPGEVRVASFERALRGLTSLSETFVASTDVTLRQYRTMLVIYSRPRPVRVGELSDELKIRVNTVSEIVDSLVKSQWVSRETLEDDRRVSLLTLTPAGVELTRSLSDAHVAYLKQNAAELIANIDTLSHSISQISGPA